MLTSKGVVRSAASAAVAFTILTATIVSAQTRPMAPGDAPNGAAAQPNGNGQAPTMPMMNGGYQPSHYPEYYHYNTGWPGAEVRAIPGAMTNRAVARAEYRRIQSGLSVMILTMRKTFERTRDYAAALAEEREAFAQLERERNEALRSVREDPSYQASLSLRQSLTDQIAHTRDDRRPYDDEIMAMAEVKLGYASTASQMESAALAADPDVQQARERLRRASARMSEMRAQHELDVRNSPELEVQRRNLQDARIAKLAAEVYYTGVRDVAVAAVDYAYWTRRYDQYQYLSYGYYGYNYPVGYPYNWRY